MVGNRYWMPPPRQFQPMSISVHAMLQRKAGGGEGGKFINQLWPSSCGSLRRLQGTPSNSEIRVMLWMPLYCKSAQCARGFKHMVAKPTPITLLMPPVLTILM